MTGKFLQLLLITAALIGCQSAPPAAPPLTEHDVVRLAHEQPSAQVLRLAVYHAGLDFPLDVAALHRLRDKGLDDEKIQAVLEGAVALETDAGVPVERHGTGAR